MKKTAISGLLLAAAASLVSAAPAKQETAERVSYSGEGQPAATEDGWVELASPTPAKHGRTFITVGGRYTQLRVDAHRGKPTVKAVRVIYADGTERRVKLERRKRSSVIDVKAEREIEHIVVEADRRSAGSYTVHGAPAEGTGVATR